MPNLIEKFGPRYFNDRFTSSLVNIDGVPMIVSGAVWERNEGHDDDEWEEREPHDVCNEIRCHPINMEQRTINYHETVSVDPDKFTDMSVLVVPPNGYRRFGPNCVGWTSRANTYAHGLNVSCVTVDETSFTRYLRSNTDLYVTMGDDVSMLLSFAYPEYDSIDDLPALFAGDKSAVVLSETTLIEPSPSRSGVPLWVVLYNGTTLGEINSDMEPVGPLARSNAELIKEVLSNGG
jgi:hypothetical protein